MTIWFTADTHFGHANIIRYAKRPFSSVEQMDEAMIHSWNDRVKPGDTIYHLGDFAFGDHNKYLPRLNGGKILIEGNHDPKRLKKAKGWAAIHKMLEVMVDMKHIVLCHYALRVWNRSHQGSLHFYGHSHGGLPGDNQSCDVGVDCWGYRPITLSEAKERLVLSPIRGHPDHHQPAPLLAS